ncbi:hypothetical protein Ga0100231_008040 [Opitutaceae bacterium TAV4]|nr:hypothetical protein Ga0100231_008040 [Opitutaceae bacterium TAV4]RRJ98405.1 hypothetical protein Ga0100230_008340 [Opitutaceae bacterium TAV3]
MGKFTLIIALTLLPILSGCITSSAISEATTTQASYFFPEQVWHDPDMNEFLLSGFRPTPTGGGKIPCYVRIPTAKLNEWKNEKNEVMLSKIGTRGTANLKLESGPIPSSYVLVPSLPNPDLISITDEKKTTHPTRFAVIPFTIVLDVITLPAQVIVVKGLSGLSGIN